MNSHKDLSVEEVIKICMYRNEIHFLFKITKHIAETDSIGEGYHYCGVYTEKDFNNGQKHSSGAYCQYLEFGGIPIYKLYLDFIQPSVFKTIASSYHQKPESIMFGVVDTMEGSEGMICQCCKRKAFTFYSLEHDNKDKNDDMNVCLSCMQSLREYWYRNMMEKFFEFE